MADGLTPPFDYSSILIGEEIIYRALLQQEEFARESKFGMSWSERDAIDKSGMFFKSNIIRSDFSISPEDQHCIVKPPCPWPKESDELDLEHFMPVLMSSDGIYTYRLEVAERIDTSDGFNIGKPVVRYESDQEKLGADVISEFTYFNPVAIIQDYSGNAVLHIKRLHRGELENTFHYLFLLK